jgi:hypothetical protein
MPKFRQVVLVPEFTHFRIGAGFGIDDFFRAEGGAFDSINSGIHRPFLIPQHAYEPPALP